jgi:hypothetical protein
MPEISYDSLIDRLIEAKMEGEGATWKVSAITFFLSTEMGATSKMISGDTGYTPRYISDLVKTFAAFPTEDDRASDKTFSIHMVCAQQDDPAAWLDRAVAEGWSVRELKRAIAGEQPTPDPVEVADRLWDKILKILAEGGPGAEHLRGLIAKCPG